MPVNPPNVKRNKNPFAQRRETSLLRPIPYKLANQLKTFTPVGTAIAIVADVK
jgi:hypothetical protein